DANRAAGQCKTQAFFALSQRRCGPFQISNVRNRSDPTADIAVCTDPRRVDDVHEPRPTGPVRNLVFILDPLAAHYALDMRTNNLEGLNTNHIGNWTSYDLFERQTNQSSHCSIGR